MAKAALWTDTDAESRKPGERTGLDTPVVLAVNDEHLVWGVKKVLPCRRQLVKCSAWGVRPQG